MDAGRSAKNRDDHQAHSSDKPASAHGQGAHAGELEDLSRAPDTKQSRPREPQGAGGISDGAQQDRSRSREAPRAPSAPAPGASQPPPIPRRMVVRGHTLNQRIALAMALILGALGAALPAVLLIWLVFALLATGVTAEVLEHTGGLAPTTFGGGFWLALLVDAVVVLWCLGKLAFRKPMPWRPLVVLVLAYVVLLWGLVPLDWAGVVDVPDALTAFAVLGANSLITYALPFVLLSLMVRGLRHAWRVGNESVATAMRITALAACLGVAGLSVTIALVAARADGYFDALTPGSNEIHALGARGVEGERRKFADLSADIGPPSPLLPGSAGADAFGTCADDLVTSPGQGRSMVELATLRLMCDGQSKTAAERNARDILFWICAQDTHEPRRERGAHYMRAVSAIGARHSERRDHHDRNELVSCAIQGWGGGDAYGSDELERELPVMHTAFDQLESGDQLVLESRYVGGMDDRALGRRLGKDKNTARNELRRARNRLWTAFQDGKARR
jgi:hypothetical protein